MTECMGLHLIIIPFISILINDFNCKMCSKQLLLIKYFHYVFGLRIVILNKNNIINDH